MFFDPEPEQDNYESGEQYYSDLNEWNSRQMKPESPENRMRYEGFLLDDEWIFNKKIKIHFHQNGEITVKHNTGSEHVFFYGKLSIKSFELICSENGIELKKI